MAAVAHSRGESRRPAARELQQLIDLRRAVDAQPADLAIEHEPHEGAGVAILAEATRALDLLVCGSRGNGAVRGVLLGSVSRRPIGAANCPVAVVPSGHEPALGALGAPLKLAG